MFQSYMVEVLPTPEVVELKDVVVKGKKKRKPPKPKTKEPATEKPVVIKVKVPKKSKVVTELKCQEAGCEHFCHNVQDMRKHLQSDHSVPIEEETINFASEEGKAETDWFPF